MCYILYSLEILADTHLAVVDFRHLRNYFFVVGLIAIATAWPEVKFNNFKCGLFGYVSQEFRSLSVLFLI